MGFALYFSRSPIPYDRTIENGVSNAALKHLGMYGYSNTFLKKFSAMDQGVLENMEKLEQLRALEMGFKNCSPVRTQWNDRCRYTRRPRKN